MTTILGDSNVLLVPQIYTTMMLWIPMKVLFAHNKVPIFKNLHKINTNRTFFLVISHTKVSFQCKKSCVQNTPFYLNVSNLKLKFLYDFVLESYAMSIMISWFQITYFKFEVLLKRSLNNAMNCNGINLWSMINSNNFKFQNTFSPTTLNHALLTQHRCQSIGRGHG
jgi:hypothetical protein